MRKLSRSNCGPVGSLGPDPRVLLGDTKEIHKDLLLSVSSHTVLDMGVGKGLLILGKSANRSVCVCVCFESSENEIKKR